MKKAILTVFLIGCCSSFLKAQLFTAVTFSPMVHLNFDEDYFSLSFGLEAGLWLSKNTCVNIGGDVDKHNVRFYSEYKARLNFDPLFIGVTLGPYLSIPRDPLDLTDFGLQGSPWVDYHNNKTGNIGTDLRLRGSLDGSATAPGIYYMLSPKF